MPRQNPETRCGLTSQAEPDRTRDLNSQNHTREPKVAHRDWLQRLVRMRPARGVRGPQKDLANLGRSRPAFLAERVTAASLAGGASSLAPQRPDRSADDMVKILIFPA